MKEKSVYEIIKKQNGEAFAQEIRRFDNGLFEIPNFPRIVKYAGRNPLPILKFLESLKRIEVVDENIDESPFELLDRAGYQSYEVTSFSEQNSILPYFEPEEELCTFCDPSRYKNYHIIHAIKKNVNEIKREDFLSPERQDEYGTSVISIQILKKGGYIKITNRYNHKVENPDNTFNSNPDNIIKGLSSALKKYFNVDFSSQDEELPAGYLYADNQILKYHHERLNIYIGDTWHYKDGAIHHLNSDTQIMVHDFILDLKEKTLTNVISDETTPLMRLIEEEIYEKRLQLQNKKGNKYLFANGAPILKLNEGTLNGLYLPTLCRIVMHGVINLPDLEEFSAPEVLCLEYASISNCPKLKYINLPKLSKVYDDCFDNMPLLQDVNIPQVLQNGKIFFGGMLIDCEQNTLVNKGCFTYSFIKALQKEMTGKTIVIKNDNADERTLFINNVPVLKERNNQIYAIYMPTVQSLGENFLRDNQSVEVFEAPNVTTVYENGFQCCLNLKKLYLPKVEKMGKRCVSKCPMLTDVDFSNLKEIDRDCFCHNASLTELIFEKLKIVKSHCLCDLPSLMYLRFGQLDYLGDFSIRQNFNLQLLDILGLDRISTNSICHLKNLQQLNIPQVEEIGVRNLENCPKLKNIVADKLKCCSSFLVGTNNIQHIYAPHLPMDEPFWIMFDNYDSLMQNLNVKNPNMLLKSCMKDKKDILNTR